MTMKRSRRKPPCRRKSLRRRSRLRKTEKRSLRKYRRRNPPPRRRISGASRSRRPNPPPRRNLTPCRLPRSRRPSPRPRGCGSLRRRPAASRPGSTYTSRIPRPAGPRRTGRIPIPRSCICPATLSWRNAVFPGTAARRRRWTARPSTAEAVPSRPSARRRRIPSKWTGPPTCTR